MQQTSNQITLLPPPSVTNPTPRRNWHTRCIYNYACNLVSYFACEMDDVAIGVVPEAQ